MKIAILGPTASEKSALAAEVARRIGGTVVNGDPFQAVEGIPIGTGQPSLDEQGAVPHIGYGCLPLTTSLNPASFGIQVRAWMEGLENLVLVTGSGLYLRGIWEQLDELPDVPERIVEQVRHWHAVVGAPRLHRYLSSVDSLRASELHPNDSSRILRALALYLATGRKPSALFTGVNRSVPEGWAALLVLPERERQRERVARRVRAMVEQGWCQEVQTLVDQGLAQDLRRLKPLGYVNWLDGSDKAEIEAEIVRETQAYAKRQGTWFRNQLPGVPVWDPDTVSVEDALQKLALYLPSTPVAPSTIMAKKNKA
jgi:tRNA dimethylallyltransferase